MPLDNPAAPSAKTPAVDRLLERPVAARQLRAVTARPCSVSRAMSRPSGSTELRGGGRNPAQARTAE